MKHLLLLFVLLITTSTVFSQLYVAPNGATDSYVFVNDEILFVEEGVNLVANNAGTTEASIYLRNDGQLIQGVTASDNEGTGKLSVYQTTPDDDAWEYTYWCSPIGNPAGAAGNTNFGILKLNGITDITDSFVVGTTTGYNGTVTGSSPQTAIEISTRWTYKHSTPGSEAESHYQRIYAGDNVNPGFGFIMKGVGTSSHPQEFDFRGRPNNGTFSIPISDALDAYSKPYWTLTGNPYPSALDLAMVVNNNPGIVANVYFWDQDSSVNSHYYTENRAGFGTWLPTGGIALPGGGTEGTYAAPSFVEWNSAGGNPGGTGGTGADYQRRFSPIGQGFMLVGSGADTGSISTATIDNSMRVFIEGIANGSEFRNPENDPSSGISINPTEPTLSDRLPEFRFITIFGESHAREMVLLFSDESTDGYDHGMDALHPMDATSEAYFPIGADNDTRKYVIQTVPFSLEKRVPINFKLNAQFEISLVQIEKINIPNTVYLWDSQENIYREITDGGSFSDVNNSFTLPAGNYENRFYIVFRGRRATEEASEGTIVKEEVRANVNFFQNNPYKQLEITNPEGYNIKSASVFDMSGKLVVTRKNLGSERNLVVSTSDLADGVYLIQLVTSENINIDYKMIIQNK